MSSPALTDHPCYAARLAQPFVRAMRRASKLPPGAFDWLEQLDGDTRLPIAKVLRLLAAAESFTHDPALGLKAAREMSLGDGGALYYAMSTAENLRSAIAVADRYARLVSDMLTVRLEERDGRALVRIEGTADVPRTVIDFRLCMLLCDHARVWPAELAEDLDVYFPYPAPSSLAEHRLTLKSARIHFAAGFSGFGFGARHLDAPLRTTDGNLHAILRRHAEQVVAKLPRSRTLAERVRQLIVEELARGNADAEHIAERLQMSRRTLNRRLEAEGLSFRGLLDEARQELALRYLGTRSLSIPEIALLTGFSEAAAFHRAFRRWTGQTPSEYRKARAQGQPSPERRLSKNSWELAANTEVSPPASPACNTKVG